MKISDSLSFFRKYSYLSVFLFILFWFFILSASGSFFSGYHFTDDHEITHINYNFTVQKIDIFQVSSQWIHNDLLTGRFRPFYYVHRILETRLLGVNFGWWSFYTGMLGVLTSFFLFIFGQMIRFSISEALLFSFLTTLGAQSAIWWQLGPAETIGTFLLAAALVFAALSEISSKYTNLSESLFIFLVLIMSLSKESFILVIPALGLIKVWLSYHLKTLAWHESLKKNSLSIFILGLFFTVELLLVKIYIGLTPEIGYAGLEGFSISRTITATQNLSQAGYWWIILASLIAIRLTIKPPYYQSLRQILNILYFPIVLLLLVSVPQVLLYAKSGIVQRYILPGILGYVFLIISLYNYLNKIYKLAAKLILLLIVIALSFNLSVVWDAAHTFGLEGKSTNALLRTIEAKTQVNDPILIVSNPHLSYEWSFSIKKYLNYVSNRNNLYFDSYVSSKNYFYQKIEKFYNYQTLDQLKNKIDLQCVVLFPYQKEIFLIKSSWFLKDNFNHYEFGNFNRNLNKNTKIHLYCKKPIAKKI
ncbi:hypothetical protein QUA54_26505 [Microcoleus sp. MOSTC5]|uniref:hypothetical protein n=1 Tax=Microcoleus sp. MOSTC5 TaxID=3055378 RepID=UPI002FD18E9F